ncbi:Permease cytosine/purine uracilthiamine allantoin [Penicillium chermesinum]|nr:Permease cytosine/purine uracilthiamine allantoin [Penicillium chermesinum]
MALSRFSIEEGGIERITDEQRVESKQRFWNAATFWFSANMAIATLNIGSLGGLDGPWFLGLLYYHSGGQSGKRSTSSVDSDGWINRT